MVFPELEEVYMPRRSKIVNVANVFNGFSFRIGKCRFEQKVLDN
ncbi:hypothetical protein D1AOALGA4SA_2160 [Olavius algarvensis Delta 1 endosymbiont]|nr:hypothetical protein D1AOALGA4SA_2160 [Olavius algarvensis Delta 1 endosymbiont]